MRWWWLAILVRSVAAEHPSLMAPVAAISSHVCRQPVYIDPVHKVLPKKSMDRGRRRKNLTQIASVRGGAGLLESGPMAAISSSKTLSWIVLVTSIGVETIGTSLSKQARESENLTLFVVSLSLYLTSMAGFALAMKQIEVGIAYALWGALGTVIVNTVGIVFFGESHDFAKLAWIALILCGVVGLNLSESH